MGCSESKDLGRDNFVSNVSVDEDKILRVKILLLGAGESGKSTILKQMRIIHSYGFCHTERMTRKGAVFYDLITSMVKLVRGAQELFSKELPDEIEEDLNLLVSAAKNFYYSDLPEHVAAVIERLWEDPVIKKAFCQRNMFQINESASYFFDELDRIRATNYIPTDEDIIMTRVESVGIQEIKYNYRSILFHVYDMPGQRSQRRKWLSYFENCNAIIFVVAVSEYDMVITEDEVSGRIDESLSLFDMAVRCRFFDFAQIILFLNKKDLFAEKLDRSPIKNYYNQFTGQNNYEDGMRFFRKMFEKKAKAGQNRKQLIVHETCATDTNQLKTALGEATNHVIEDQLHSAGMI